MGTGCGEEAVQALVAHVDTLAEIPNSLRHPTEVVVRTVGIEGGSSA